MVSFVYGPARAGDRRRARPQGKVARYARGADYHGCSGTSSTRCSTGSGPSGPSARGRAVADTAPLLERDFARLAGLGWIGKNTMLIDRRLGSFTFLGALLTDLELAYDAAARGRPLRDLHAMPRRLPDRRLRRPLPARRPALHQLLDDRAQGARSPMTSADQLDGWVFGCDVCQDVCPWNRKAPSGRMPELEPRPEWVDPDLIGWLDRRSRRPGGRG